MEEDQQLLSISQLHYMLLCSVDKAIKGRTPCISFAGQHTNHSAPSSTTLHTATCVFILANECLTYMKYLPYIISFKGLQGY